jgi:hypothetical protein
MADLSICARCLSPNALFKAPSIKVLLAIAVAALTGATAMAADISIRLEDGSFRVEGWSASAEPPEGWAWLFPVYAGPTDLQPLAGSYEAENRVLKFHPRFPIEAGVHYHAVFRLSASVRAEASFDGPPRPGNSVTRVDRIYPSADVLPDNTLRLYIYFSAPMSRGEAWTHIHLLDVDKGTPVELPFLELEQELWNQTNQCLTVLFDPGRIKRGLVPTTTVGPAVVEGKRYKLVIDREWKDARGVPLVEPFEKSFRGGPSDRTPPDPKKWRVASPKAGTTEPVVITFPKPMDYVLLQRMIGVFDPRGEVSGRIEVTRNETEWRFSPREAWRHGRYRITADNTLEDISGNHLDRPFDVDIFEKVTKHIATTTSSVTFVVQ